MGFRIRSGVLEQSSLSLFENRALGGLFGLWTECGTEGSRLLQGEGAKLRRVK